MNSGDKFDLLMRYLDRRLGGEDLRTFNDLLRSDAELRDWLREISCQAVALGDVARREARQREARVIPLPASIHRKWLPRLAWAAGVVLLAGIGAVWLQQRSTANGPTLVEANGTVVWSRDGKTQRASRPGSRLSAGTLESVGDGAAAHLRFPDGSRFTLAGNSELSFAVREPNRLALKRGSLTGTITPQRAGHPWVVHTPTAEIEVLGTVFTLNALTDATQLNVEEGRVRLRRLVDGRVEEIPAKHSAVASLDPRETFCAVALSAPPVEWEARCEAPPPRASKAEWRDANGGVPARWRAVPLVMGRRADGAPVIHFGVSLRDTAQPWAGSFVALAPDSRLTLRWRSERPTRLLVLLITQRPGGGFGGNFEWKSPQVANAANGAGWQETSLSLSDFAPLLPNHAEFAGHGLSALIITAFGKDAGLEVAAVRVDAPPKP